MGGVLCKGDPSGVEATGVYQGVLVEDMIDTVKRVKKPFIDVFIEGMFFKDADYPLTYVPMFNMVLPLKKDQKVFVYFNQDNQRYPVLWKLADEVSKEYIDKYGFPKGGLVSFPDAEDTTEVTKFSDFCWFIGTKSYGVFNWGEQCVLLNKDSIITNARGSLQYKSGGDFVVESFNDIILKSTAGKVTLNGTGQDLGSVLCDLVQHLLTYLPTATVALPTGSVCPVYSPTFMSDLNSVLGSFQTGFKGS